MDAPIRTGCGQWCIVAPAGRAIVAGHSFEKNGGYRVTLRFTDSHIWNSLSVEAARAVTRTLREQPVRNVDAMVLAAEIERWADCCERLNMGWAILGRPSGGFDARGMETQTGAISTRKANATLKVSIGSDVSLDLRIEAKRRGVAYDALAAEIIDAVVTHKLFAAVLDQ